jgi:uncharacterized Zn finger protein
MVVMVASPAFTEADIKLAAGARSFERGLDYLSAVADLEVTSSRITASVYGNDEYRVCLIAGDEGLGGGCTCPHGQDGFFCKHCVAVGLSVLGMGEDLTRHMEAAQASRQALESWLQSLSKQELLAELLGLLDEDKDLRERFELRVAAANADTVTVRRAVMELVTPPRREYIDYNQAHSYTSDVYKAAAAIDDLIENGEAADAIEIAREAIDQIAGACGSVDDSSGSVVDAGYELLAAHLRACQAAPPDPVSLGDYLAELLLYDDYGFGPDLEDYAELLGDRGTATVRERVAAAYAEDPKGWRAKMLMESIARAEGDVDAVIAIYAADLDDRGLSYVRIARELDQVDRADEALGWAERGLREAAHPDHQLIEYLASRYAAAGRDHAVLGLRRDRFRAERTLANYRALRQAATEAGTWSAERDEALALLRQDARDARNRVPWPWSGAVLIDALLDDGDVDDAWAAAQNVATDPQWRRLADASITSRPADALAVYLKAIGSLKGMTGDKAYRQMAALLLSARACHDALGTTGEFKRYLVLFRMEQKRKRNLMKILDENGL